MFLSVKKYWMVNPEVDSIHIHSLNGNTLEQTDVSKGNDRIKSKLFEGLKIKLEDIFKN